MGRIQEYKKLNETKYLRLKSSGIMEDSDYMPIIFVFMQYFFSTKSQPWQVPERSL